MRRRSLRRLRVCLRRRARAPRHAADQRNILGRTVTDVRVEIAGAPVIDPGVLELIETRIGEPLDDAARCATTIDHLVGLGRFEDVRVFAAPADQGVALRWQLTPVRRIARVSVTGNAVLPAAGDPRRARRPLRRVSRRRIASPTW